MTLPGPRGKRRGWGSVEGWKEGRRKGKGRRKLGWGIGRKGGWFEGEERGEESKGGGKYEVKREGKERKRNVGKGILIENEMWKEN